MPKQAPAVVEMPSDREVLVTRSFGAPPELVYLAFTKPELVRRWLQGPPGWTMPVCEIDLRVGGRYRYRWAGANGESFGFVGQYRLIEPNRRIDHSERMEEAPDGGDCQCSLRLEPTADGTRITLLMAFESQKDRDAALATGMTDGMEMTYQLLDELLGETASP